MTDVPIRQRSVPDRLRYLAAKLREGGHEQAVALALEVMADETGDVAGYVVLREEMQPGGDTATTIVYYPQWVYGDEVTAQREAQRAQAHADLDVDLNDGRRCAHSAGEVRRVKGAP